MSDTQVTRIAESLEKIVEILDAYFVIPQVPQPPRRLAGSEAISYIDDQVLIELEEEEERQRNRGLIPTPENN